MKTVDSRKLAELIAEMIDTLEGLGYVPTARIDARVWAKFYRRKFDKLMKKKQKYPPKGFCRCLKQCPHCGRKLTTNRKFWERMDGNLNCWVRECVCGNWVYLEDPK